MNPICNVKLLFDIGTSGWHLKWGLFFENYCQKTIEIENETIHYNLRNDLVEHLWAWKGNNMYWNKYYTFSISNIYKNPLSCDEICGLMYVSSSSLCKCGELSNVIKCESSPNEIVGWWYSLVLTNSVLWVGALCFALPWLLPFLVL
jgi:hypothetical protein